MLKNHWLIQFMAMEGNHSYSRWLYSSVCAFVANDVLLICNGTAMSYSRIAGLFNNVYSVILWFWHGVVNTRVKCGFFKHRSTFGWMHFLITHVGDWELKLNFRRLQFSFITVLTFTRLTSYYIIIICWMGVHSVYLADAATDTAAA